MYLSKCRIHYISREPRKNTFQQVMIASKHRFSQLFINTSMKRGDKMNLLLKSPTSLSQELSFDSAWAWIGSGI